MADISFDDIEGDIDLTLSPEDEIAKIQALDAEIEVVEEVAEDTSEEVGEKGGEEEGGEEGESTETAEDPATGTDATAAMLEDLRAERQRLQEQLNELAVSSLADRRRLEAIERSVTTPKEPEAPKEPEGPTPQQIINHLDNRIAQVDAALTRAEAENSEAVPQLRANLRQLERYYNNYVSQQTLQAAQGPDPQAVVQQAVQETEQQTRFKTVRTAIVNEFPVLDEHSQYFNAEMRDQIHRVYNPMLAAGADPVQALVEATQLVTRAHGIMSISEWQQQQQQQAAKEAEDATKAEAAEKAKLAANARKTAAVSKNIAAAAATPPNMANIGTSGQSHGVLDKYDFSKMSIEEMLRIPDSESELIENALALYGT